MVVVCQLLDEEDAMAAERDAAEAAPDVVTADEFIIVTPFISF